MAESDHLGKARSVSIGGTLVFESLPIRPVLPGAKEWAVCWSTELKIDGSVYGQQARKVSDL